ncbi:MAG: hypothetical protein HZB50_03720 [Chloroflexi bacterium]|nr:hypothetical protein [Chloroflexota bacterium]
MSKPLLVKIITYAPTAFYHCTHCEIALHEIGISNQAHEEQLQSGLPEDLKNDYLIISEWVRDIFRRYRDQIVIKMVDAVSLEGIWLSLRNGTRHYPAIIIGEQAFVGIDALTPAETSLGGLLQKQSAA